MADFEVIKHLGKGAFGQVLEVRWAVVCGRLIDCDNAAGFGEADEKIVCSEGDE